MGIKFYGNVHIPTLRFGPRFQQIGRMIFEDLELSSKIHTSTSSLSTVENINVNVSYEPSGNTIFDNSISINTVSNILHSPAEISVTVDNLPQGNVIYDSNILTLETQNVTLSVPDNILANIEEQDINNDFYNSGIFTVNEVSSGLQISNIVDYTDETLIINEYYNSGVINNNTVSTDEEIINIKYYTDETLLSNPYYEAMVVNF